jgi:hypothetical protein
VTALVGIYCKDGIVVGADSAATSSTAGGVSTIEQPLMKIEIIGGRLIIAGTGQIGLGQRFTAVAKKLCEEKKLLECDPHAVAKTLAQNALRDWDSTFAPKGQYGALVAFPCKKDRHLVEFASVDFQPEFKNSNLWYVSMGSAQTIMDPLLALMRQVFWADGPPSIQDAIFAATWMLDHAVTVNPGGVNQPVRIAVMETVNDEWRARLLTEEELLEHRGNVEAAKEALRNYKVHMAKSEGAEELPLAPQAAA